MITVGTLFLVVGAVERSHVVDWFARKTFGAEGSVWMGKARMYCTCFSLSVFFNNTPLVAILMPVVKDWARMRGIAASQLLIPLSFSVLAGSFGSMIGTSTNLTVQGLMEADRGYSFNFFAPAPIGFPCFFLLLIYQLICGPLLLPNNKSGLLREARDKAQTLIAEVYVSEHSLAVGKSLGEMMNSLGVAPTSAIKIRRKARNQYTDRDTSADAAATLARAPSILDKEYLKQQASFWLTKPVIPDRVDYHTPTGSAKLSADEVDLEAASGEYHDIIAPSHQEPVCAEDVIFISSAQDAVQKMMKSILGESRGLYILQSNVMALPGFGSEVLELVLSDSSPFVGKKVKDITGEFAEKYNAGLITVRGKDWNIDVMHKDDDKDSVEGEEDESGPAGKATGTIAIVPSEDPSGIEMTAQGGSNSSNDGQEVNLVHHVHAKVVISEHVLQYGDVILAVTNKKDVEALSHNRDFFVVSTVGSLPKPLTFYRLIPVFVFILMLCLVASEYIEMCPAALTVTAFFFMGGWLTPDDIPKMVDIRLLMLLGCSLSFAKAMTKSGLALEIASTINDANPSNFGALLLVYAITLVITELISNNAAAALMYPIAVALADEMGVSYKPFSMAVMISASAGFMSPIGYQTHVMVWAPGGYRFKDFVIFGFIPDLIFWFPGCALIAAVFPFSG